MFCVQLSILWSNRGALFVVLFLWAVFLTTLSLSGFLRSVSDDIIAEWLGLFVLFMAMIMIFFVGSRKRFLFFQSLGCEKSWIRAQWVAINASLLPFILLCFFIDCFAVGCLQSFVIAALRLLFTSFCAQIVFGGLQKKISTLTPSVQYGILLVLSAPWLLIMYLLGIGCSLSLLNGENIILPMLGMIALGLCQTIFSRFDDTPHTNHTDHSC